MLTEVKAAFGRYVETVRDVIMKYKAEKLALEAEVKALKNEIDIATADLMPATLPWSPSDN